MRHISPLSSFPHCPPPPLPPGALFESTRGCSQLYNKYPVLLTSRVPTPRAFDPRLAYSEPRLIHTLPIMPSPYPTLMLPLLSALFLVVVIHAVVEFVSHLFAYLRINCRPRPSRFAMCPTALDFRHIVPFFLLTIPYHIHAFRAALLATRLHLFPSTRKPVLPSYPVRYLLESSLVNYVHAAPDLGPSSFRFRLDNFLSPLCVGKTDCSFLVEFDVHTLHISTFRYNGTCIHDDTERLSLLVHTTATATHPAIHKHQDEHYAQRHRVGAQYNNLFLHGPLLNEYAYFYAGLLFRHGISWFRTVLTENALRLQPKGHSLCTYRKLMPYSRYVHFAMAARQILFQLVRIHGLNVDAEMLFINCVIHSLDHFVPSFLDDVYMEHKQTSNKPLYNLVRSIFYDSMGRHEPFHTNFLVDNKHVNPFYSDLYNGFSKIDEEIADWITLSISF